MTLAGRHVAGGQVVPAVGQDEIARDAVARLVERSERKLRFDAALVGGGTVPPSGFGRVSPNRQAVMVQVSQVELRGGVSPLRQALDFRMSTCNDSARRWNSRYAV